MNASAAGKILGRGESTDKEKGRHAQSAAMRASLFDGAPDPIFLVDQRHQILEVNRRAVELFKIPRSKLIQSDFTMLFERGDGSLLNEIGQQGWTGLEDRRFDVKGGRCVSLNATSVISELEVLYQISVRDETVRTLLDQALMNRTRMEALARQASLMAMDLNDSMAIIQGRLELELALNSARPEKEKRHLSIAFDHARRVTATLHNLRLVGRTVVSRLTDVLAAEAVQAALDLIGPRASRRNIEIDVEECLLAGKSPSYARAFANLLGYVLDTVRKDDAVVIRAFAVPGERVILQMYGGPAVVGIDQLFAVPSPMRRSEALGKATLSLDVARMLVEQFGGELREWRSGNSIIIRLNLPQWVPSDSEKLKHWRLLLVGRKELTSTLAALLEHDVGEIVLVETAEQALDQIRNGTDYDALVAELILPGLSGLALARQVGDGTGPRVVVMSEAPFEDSDSVASVIAPPWTREMVIRALI
jgi:CheY-like chemotaxis protein